MKGTIKSWLLEALACLVFFLFCGSVIFLGLILPY